MLLLNSPKLEGKLNRQREQLVKRTKVQPKD